MGLTAFIPSALEFLINFPLWHEKDFSRSDTNARSHEVHKQPWLIVLDACTGEREAWKTVVGVPYLAITLPFQCCTRSPRCNCGHSQPYNKCQFLRLISQCFLVWDQIHIFFFLLEYCCPAHDNELSTAASNPPSDSQEKKKSIYTFPRKQAHGRSWRVIYQAAMTKYHSRVGLNNRHWFLTALETGKSQVSMREGSVPGEGPDSAL